MNNENETKFPELTLMEGGPGDALMKRLRLIRPELGSASARTAVILAMVTWLPLLVLTSIEGVALSGTRIPFLYDLSAYARFLIAIPILVLAEIPIGRRLRLVTKHFLNAGLVSYADLNKFNSYVIDTVRFHDSRLVEVILITAAYVSTYASLSNVSLHGSNTWFLHSPDKRLTLVGYYYALVAMPMFQFLMYRWAFRMFVWTRLLWQIARLDLKLTPTHPDGAGGLGFLGKGSIPFGVLLFALSSVVSAAIYTRILFDGAKLEQFQVTYAALIIVAVMVFAGPLMVFAPKLFRAKQQGLLKYGILASRYTQLFDGKWVESAGVAEEPLLGSADIQSLADLGNSYELVRKMRGFPIELSDFVGIALPGIIPALPLITTVMPIGEILKSILRLLG
jgi:hypothetical protein